MKEYDSISNLVADITRTTNLIERILENPSLVLLAGVISALFLLLVWAI
jgi:hypothetical protein